MKIPPLVWDILAGLGLILLLWGLICIYPPVALLAAGVAFIFLGFWGAAVWVKEKKVSKRRRE